MNFPEGFLVLDCELSFGMIKGFDWKVGNQFPFILLDQTNKGKLSYIGPIHSSSLTSRSRSPKLSIQSAIFVPSRRPISLPITLLPSHLAHNAIFELDEEEWNWNWNFRCNHQLRQRRFWLMVDCVWCR